MSIDREHLIEDAFRAQHEVFSAVMAAATPFWLGLDLSMAQVRGLMILAASESTTVSQVAERLGIGRSATSLLMERLVQAGLVARAEDTRDRRRTLVRLSPRGEELMSRLRQGEGKPMPLKTWLSRLSDPDLVALAQGVSALAAEVRADGLARQQGSGFPAQAPDEPP